MPLKYKKWQEQFQESLKGSESNFSQKQSYTVRITTNQSKLFKFQWKTGWFLSQSWDTIRF